MILILGNTNLNYVTSTPVPLPAKHESISVETASNHEGVLKVIKRAVTPVAFIEEEIAVTSMPSDDELLATTKSSFIDEYEDVNIIIPKDEIDNDESFPTVLPGGDSPFSGSGSPAKTLEITDGDDAIESMLSEEDWRRGKRDIDHEPDVEKLVDGDVIFGFLSRSGGNGKNQLQSNDEEKNGKKVDLTQNAKNAEENLNDALNNKEETTTNENVTSNNEDDLSIDTSSYGNISEQASESPYASSTSTSSDEAIKKEFF